MSKKPNEIDKIIGKNIKKIRLSRGYSQRQAGQKLGVTYQQFQKYEWGISKTMASSLYILANFFKVEYKKFFLEDKSIIPVSKTSTRAIRKLFENCQKLSKEKMKIINNLIKILNKEKK